MMAVNTDRANYLQTVIFWPGAGDAVGILQRLSMTTFWSFCFSSEPSS
jgi:hypothetical protein